MIKFDKIPKFFRFVMVGVVNTAIDLGVLNILIAIFGLTQPFSYSLYKSISFVLALLNSYFMNKRFTFEMQESRKNRFYFFVFFSLIGLAANVGLASLSFNILKNTRIFSNIYAVATVSGILGTLLGMVINFFSYSYLVFK